MGSVNISIKAEAYNFLKSLKTNDTSFSDVILEFRNKKKKQDIMRFFGVLKDKKDWNSTEKRMKSFRDSFNKRMGKQLNDRS